MWQCCPLGWRYRVRPAQSGARQTNIPTCIVGRGGGGGGGGVVVVIAMTYTMASMLPVASNSGQRKESSEGE